MFSDGQKSEILVIWESYEGQERIVIDPRGGSFPDIDELRLAAIPSLRSLLVDFFEGRSTLGQLKTSIDSFNKRNNHWGFTAVKGQMFFNQLARTESSGDRRLTAMLKSVLRAPADLEEALGKIVDLSAYCDGFFSKAKDRRTAPNPGSTGYFLSYFWQLQDHESWPIMYTSLIKSFLSLGLMADAHDQGDLYRDFFCINAGIADLILEKRGERPSHWEIEHAFWNYDKGQSPQPRPAKAASARASASPKQGSQLLSRAIKPEEYLIPKVARLVELGADNETSGAKKGYLFEQMVAEVFKQLDFEIEILGQGSGRNPDVIATFREENTAFLIDAKAYSEGYSLGLDDRAMREYINNHCPRLSKEGYKRIGFIVVSNSFKTDLDEFVNEVTWNTDIKRFILLESEALLYLLAYKTRDKLKLPQLIESLVSLGNPISAGKVIEEFEDV